MTAKNKGPLTKVEKFYIENNRDKKVSDVAKDLDRTTKTVAKHIDSIDVGKGHIAKSKNEGEDVGDLMAKNERYGVSIMTQEASMAGDTPPSPKNQFNPKIMSKIKDK